MYGEAVHINELAVTLKRPRTTESQPKIDTTKNKNSFINKTKIKSYGTEQNQFKRMV